MNQPTSNPLHPSASSGVEGPKTTILIAEDDAFMRALLNKQLVKAGYEVLEAADGKEALELLQLHRPCVLICDWMMPEMDGLELCRRVKDDPDLERTYILMTTSKEDQEDLVKALDSGADDYLKKPWDIRELLARVRVGLRIENLQRTLADRNEEFINLNRLMNQDMELLNEIQKAMLPQKIPRTPALDFTAWYFTSTTSGGGDYYDVIKLDKDHLGYVIADVSGHGAPAMITMALLRQTFHIFAKKFKRPNLLLQALNRLMFDHLPTDKYATMLYAIINTRTLKCRYSSAGHNPPLWYRKKENDTVLLENCEGFPLKLVTPDALYESTEIQLSPGDKIVFYTDGIPECFNSQNQNYGMERFENLVNVHAPKCTPEQLQTEMINDLMRFNDSQIPEDDLTIVIVGVKEPAAE